MIMAEQRHYIKDSNGNIEKEKIPIKLEPCREEHWKYIPGYEE